MSNGRQSIVIFRSICCGIAGTIVAVFVWAFAFVVFTMIGAVRSSPGEEVGFDFVTLFHNSSHHTTELLALAGFAIGFALGYRHFSRSLQNR